MLIFLLKEKKNIINVLFLFKDIDHYKQSVKENINVWLAKLKAKKIYDYLIVVVDHSESKKTNKTKLLPRTTVLDKMKSDFPSQSNQRYG